MPVKHWKSWPDSCDECGDDLEVFTDDERDGWAFDGDAVRCVTCTAKGVISAPEEDDVSIIWNEVSSGTLDGREWNQYPNEETR